MLPYKSYFICTSPRSGSTLLCKMLAATGRAGNPKSYFHDASLASWESYLELPSSPTLTECQQITRILSTVQTVARGRSHMSGVRLQRHSFEFFAKQLALLLPDLPNTSARIEQIFGTTLFVHLTRQDKLAQSVSYLKAEQTGLWHRGADGRELERLAPPSEPVFDRDAIAANVKTMESHDRDWQKWFRSEGLRPHVIQYDDLADNPHQTLAGLLSVLGLDPEMAKDVAPPVAQLSDAVNQDWIARFQNP